MQHDDSAASGHLRASRPPARAIGGIGAALLAGAAVLTALGCSEPRSRPSGAMTVTVAPGQTGTCAISPCRVLFEMPPGEAAYQVRGRDADYGRYPAGRTVNLGNFYEPITIDVVGAGVPRAYVYIPVQM
jgi:hypothetical protein